MEDVEAWERIWEAIERLEEEVEDLRKVETNLYIIDIIIIACLIVLFLMIYLKLGIA
jgi:cell division protein FtsL